MQMGPLPRELLDASDQPSLVLKVSKGTLFFF